MTTLVNTTNAIVSVKIKRNGEETTINLMPGKTKLRDSDLVLSYPERKVNIVSEKKKQVEKEKVSDKDKTVRNSDSDEDKPETKTLSLNNRGKK